VENSFSGIWEKSKNNHLQLKEVLLLLAKHKGAGFLVALLMLLLITTAVMAEEEEEMIRVTGVNLDQTQMTLQIGQRAELSAVVYPLNATDRRVRWINSNPEVVEIAGSEHTVELISRAQGEATVTVITYDGGQEKNCLVEVVIPVRSIGIDQEELVMAPGETTVLAARVEPREANEQGVAWESDQPKVAVVDDKGEVKALEAGEARIIARSEEDRRINAYSTITVSDTALVPASEEPETAAEPAEAELPALTADSQLTGLLIGLGVIAVFGGGAFLALLRKRRIKTGRPVLVGLSGAYAGQKMDFINNQITIGRDPDQAQVLYPQDEGEISRRHCTVYYDQNTGQISLEDTSFNGTFLADGQKIGEGQKHNLQPGKTFSLTESGDSFTVELE